MATKIKVFDMSLGHWLNNLRIDIQQITPEPKRLLDLIRDGYLRECIEIADCSIVGILASYLYLLDLDETTEKPLSRVELHCNAVEFDPYCYNESLEKNVNYLNKILSKLLREKIHGDYFPLGYGQYQNIMGPFRVEDFHIEE